MTTRTFPSGRKLALATLLAGAAGVAFAADTATQSATYEVQPINELSVSGNPGALVINAATAGSAPNQVSDATSSYAITTNESTRRITAAIDTAMPAGVTLKVSLAAPTGATSAGAVTLGTVATDVVTGISTLNESGKVITYTLDATSAAGVVTSASKTVTYTIAATI
ncbi:hypothetical protein ebA2787 [Aromatoleum aromaticum EbN1]|uniref:Uncharacterized protein n=1 Tax=Aromatoleum aromaticum (strain DSM 19018 / LMG 30748 / EbN1) TaxID=76114 RepID=Q5P4S3_AROAE|nr:hypothetical protein [Aromatoleum aromaticum]CAI07689.1 hypothetical protein ebA2787 [Aromatoleum aromaticum EbN1]